MKRTNGLVIIDLNVFAHMVKGEIERSIQPISPRYNMRAVAKAKRELQLVREAKADHKNNDLYWGGGRVNFKEWASALDMPSSIKAANAALRVAKAKQSDEQSIIQACFVWLISGQWLGELRDEHSAIAFVGDLKCPWSSDGQPINNARATSDRALVKSGYWRHWYLQQPEVYKQIPDKPKNARRTSKTKKPVAYMTKPLHYKAGRKFPSPVLGRVRKELYRLITAKGYPLLWSKGDEADDHAALIVRVNEQKSPARQRPITLVTTDGDWTQLVSDSTRWFCMHGYYPRIRHTMQDLNKWRAFTGSNGAIAKAKRRYGADVCADSLETPQDIVKLKFLMGDASDALPPGSPAEVIDLRNPPTEFDLANDKWAVAGANEVLNTLDRNILDDTGQVEHARAFLRSRGFKLPIRTYEPDPA